MLTRVLTATALLALGATAAFAWRSSQEPQAEMMAKWMEFMTPSEGHKLLEPRVGRWTMKVTMFEPGAPPTESTGTCEVKWILEGRYLEDTTESSFQGMPFHGRGLLGYDNLKKKYVMSWVDNMGTGIATGEGTWDAASKSITYATQVPDLMKGTYAPARSVEKVIDADHWTMESFANGPDGKEMLMMRIEYARAGK